MFEHLLFSLSLFVAVTIYILSNHALLQICIILRELIECSGKYKTELFVDFVYFCRCKFGSYMTIGFLHAARVFVPRVRYTARRVFGIEPHITKTKFNKKGTNKGAGSWLTNGFRERASSPLYRPRLAAAVLFIIQIPHHRLYNFCLSS